MKVTSKVSSPQNSNLLIPDKPSRLHEELAKCWAASIGLGEWHCWRRITYGPENVGKKTSWKLCTVAYSYIISCLFSLDIQNFFEANCAMLRIIVVTISFASRAVAGLPCRTFSTNTSFDQCWRNLGRHRGGLAAVNPKWSCVLKYQWNGFARYW